MARVWKYPLVLSFATHALLSGALLAQVAEQDIDLAFETRIREFPAEVRQADESAGDELQRTFAQESFDYYLQHPATSTGGHAAEAAFRFWGKLGATAEIEAALRQLTGDFSAWRAILTDVDIGYTKRSKRDSYFELLGKLETELTHPIPKSEVQFRLGKLYFDRQQRQEAVDRFESALLLNPDSHSARAARRYLNEIKYLAIGQIAPEFDALTLQGRTFALSDSRGQPILLEFWATWCGPCIAEIPHLKKLQVENPEFQIIGISFDGSLEVLREFLEEDPIPWIQIVDPAGLQGELAELFNVSSIPRSILLDGDGRIFAKNLRGERLAMAVAELIGASKD